MTGLLESDQLIAFLRVHRLWLRKTSGQHFLIDSDVLNKIVTAAKLKPTDHVLEIGPGLGTLTQALANAVPNGLVLAVEKDYRLVELLRKEFKHSQNVKIVHEDARKFLNEGLGAGSSGIGIDNKYSVVANLPYNISGLILRCFFDPSPQLLIPSPQSLVLMLQQEVVDRLLAPPGSSKRGLLTILRELFGPAERIVDVPKTAFFPVPLVDSAVIRIGSAPSYDPETSQKILWLAKLGLAAKRRTLANTLTAGLRWSKADVRALLEQAQIDERVRAEDLALADWRRLAEISVF